MNTDDLYTFIKASEMLNFSKAAEELNYSQSAVTIQIKKLEKEFGVQLFNRIGKNISLTPAGKQFLLYAHNIINEVEFAKEIMGNPSAKDHQIRIGCISSLANTHMPLIFENITKDSMNIYVNILTGSPTKLFDKLDKDQVDMVYILDRSRFSENWIKVFDKKEKLNFVTADPSLKDKKLQIEDIINMPFFLTEKNDNYRYALDKKLAEKELEVFPILEAANTDILIKVLKQGIGIAYLPEFVYCPYVQSGDLHILEIDGFELEMSRQLFYHRNKFITKEMREFIELIKGI